MGRKDKIIQYWLGRENEEISSSELLDEFVYKYKKYSYSKSGDIERWNGVHNGNSVTLNKKPEALYNTDTSFHRDLGELCDKGFLKRKKKRKNQKYQYYYQLHEKHKIEPLKIYHQNQISRCYNVNILSLYSSLFYLPNFDINAIEYEKLKEIQKHDVEISFHYSQIQDIFEDVVVKEVDKEWNKFLDKSTEKSLVKLFCWLFLIKYKVKNQTLPRVDKILRTARSDEFRKIMISNPNELEKIRDEEVISWNKNFDRLFSEAVFKLFNDNFPEKYYSVLNDWKQLENKVEQKIWKLENLEYEKPYFLGVVDSSSIARNHGDINENIDSISERNYRYEDNFETLEIAYKVEKERNVKKDSKSVKTLKVDKNKDFFKENDFFNGFEERLKELFIKKEELYEELDEFGNKYTFPSIPN